MKVSDVKIYTSDSGKIKLKEFNPAESKDTQYKLCFYNLCFGEEEDTAIWMGLDDLLDLYKLIDDYRSIE